MKLPILCLCLFASTFGCHSVAWFEQDPGHVDEGLVAALPDAQQEKIQEARIRRDKLNDQLAAARSDLKEAKSLLDLSERDLANLRSRLTTTRREVTHATTYSTDQDVDTARQEREDVEAAVRLAAAQRDYNQDLVDLAERRITLLNEHVALADSRVELAKARAVSQLDRPGADKIDVDEHRRAVLRHADQVTDARIEVQVARKRVDLRRQFVADYDRAVPSSMRLRKVEPVDSVFEAKPLEEMEVRFDNDELAPVALPPRRMVETDNGVRRSRG